MTAHYLAFTTYPLKPGDFALVHAGAGGTGLLLIQMAKRAGAYVFATVSTEEKAALAREAGADNAIIYTHEDFEEEGKKARQRDASFVLLDISDILNIRPDYPAPELDPEELKREK